MITAIDPTEALLAVIGVRPIISRQVEKVYRRDLAEANRMPARIEALARAVCRRELVDVPMGDFKYTAALRDLNEKYNEAQVEAMVRTMPEEIKTPFVLKAGEVFQMLAAEIPKSVTSTITGFRNVLPDDMAVHKFIAKLDALDDPLRVFPWMATGSITKRQIEAVRQVYPTISAAIDEALHEAAGHEKAAKKSWELSPHAEIGVGKWSGHPRIPPGLGAKMQANYAEAHKPPPAQHKSGKDNAVAKEALSPAQVQTFAGQTK